MKNKKKTKEKEHGKRTIALSQILILVIATIAFSWMVGSEVKTVSAAPSATEISACNNQRFCLNGKIYAGHLIGDPSTCVGDTLLELQTCPSGQCLPDGSQCFVDTADPKTPSKIGNWAGNIAGGVIGGTLTPLLTEQTRRLFKIGTSSKISPINTPTTSIPPLGSTAPLGPNQLAPGPTTMPKTSTWDKVIGNHLLRRIFYNAAWAAVTATVITYFAKQWASPRNAGDIAIVAWVGGGIGVVIGTLVTTAWWSGPIAAAIVILATAIYMLVGYQIYSREIFTFRVGLWQPTSIGSECNKCNSLTIGGENACSEYICHSYGTACEWVNGETQYEACIEVGRGDVAAPGIKPVKEVYGENVFPIVDNANYDYTTNSAGAKIIYKGEGAGTGQCVPAFTSVTLAVNTSEYAHCKIGLEPSTGATNAEKFGKMKDMAEGTSYTINHTVKLSSSVAADQASLEAAGYELTNGGVFKFYIRCQDVRGNINSFDYIMQFCVQQEPDTRAPQIIGTNPAQGSYITYGVDKIENFQVFTNEPAECKWDTKRVSFSDMTYTFSRCSQNLNNPLVEFDSGCQDNLTQFKNGVENKYYIACKDHPELKGTAENKRNTMRPYEVVLIGTRRLLITNVRINEKPNNSLIIGPEENVNVKIEVETFGGAEDGKARCMYSTNGGVDYSLFSNEGSREYSTINTETLSMPPEKYKLFIQCFDIAAPIPNLNTTMINFTVQTDNTAPTVVRVYRDEDTNALKLITNEVAECVYTTSGCTYLLEEGNLMETEDGLEHYVEWDPTNDFYIKCKDEFNHYPADGQCSLIARPFEIAEVVQ